MLYTNLKLLLKTTNVNKIKETHTEQKKKKILK